MSIALTNLRRRLVTILLPAGSAGSNTGALRIASMQTVTGLEDSVLDLPAVQAALRAGELEARRVAPTTPPLAAAQSQSPRSRKAKTDG